MKAITSPKSYDSQIVKIDSDFLKIFVSALVASVTFYGYSYAHQFYRSFGISLAELDFTPLDIFFRGTFVIVFDSSLFVLSFSFLLLMSALFAFLIRVTPALSFPLLVLASATILYVSSYSGISQAQKHVQAIVGEGAGRIAACKLSSESSLSTIFARLIAENRLRYIARNQSYTFIAVVNRNDSDQQLVGQSYAIPNDEIEYCRVLGTG